QRYGLAVSDVVALTRSVRVTPLPEAPHGVVGIINYRQRTAPVYSLRARFRLPQPDVQLDDQFIITTLDERVGGLCVDRAIDLAHFDRADLDMATGVAPGIEYVRWIARAPHELILIHNVKTFLNESESQQLARALDAWSRAQHELGNTAAAPVEIQ